MGNLPRRPSLECFASRIRWRVADQCCLRSLEEQYPLVAARRLVPEDMSKVRNHDFH